MRMISRIIDNVSEGRNMYDKSEARSAIRALLDAAANPKLTDNQARTLVFEAIDNAELVFGDESGRELIGIAIEKTLTIFERGFDNLSDFAGKTAHQFAPNRHRSIEVICLSCEHTLSIPLILSGQQSLYDCPGKCAG
jgi:hypothetical protein